jgi:hypothetical protein
MELRRSSKFRAHLWFFPLLKMFQILRKRASLARTWSYASAPVFLRTGLRTVVVTDVMISKISSAFFTQYAGSLCKKSDLNIGFHEKRICKKWIDVCAMNGARPIAEQLHPLVVGKQFRLDEKAVWQDWAKIRHFADFLQNLAHKHPSCIKILTMRHVKRAICIFQISLRVSL